MAKSIRLENVVLSYPHLFQKHQAPGSQIAKYGAEFILDPTTNAASVQAVMQAFAEAATEAGKGGDALKYLKPPLKSGDELNGEALAKGKNARPEFVGKYVIRASDAQYAPAVVNRMRQPITEQNQSQIFSGCIVNAFIDLFWSKNALNPGVYAGLRGVQLMDNQNVVEMSGGGAMSAEEMFEAIPGGLEPLQAPGGIGPAAAPMAPPAAPAAPGAFPAAPIAPPAAPAAPGAFPAAPAAPAAPVPPVPGTNLWG